MEAFTARNVAKFVAHNAVKFYTAGVAHTAITDHTQFEDDDFVVDIASTVVGWGVAHHTKPYTDKIVDKAADFIVAKRVAKAAKTVTE